MPAPAPAEVLANVLLFVPLGVYLGLLVPWWRSWCIGAAGFGASLAMETVQHLLSVGSFDSTDVLANTAGGLVGLLVLGLARRRLRGRTDLLLTRALAVTTVVAVLAAGVFVASPLRYRQQRDVVVSGLESLGDPAVRGDGRQDRSSTSAVAAAAGTPSRPSPRGGDQSRAIPRVRAWQADGGRMRRRTS